MLNQTECQHPSCTEDASNTYTGEHDNALRVCDRHYYRLVTGDGITTPTGTDPINPSWDSGFRCDSSTGDILEELDLDEDTTLAEGVEIVWGTVTGEGYTDGGL